jgi:serine-type D-Ala-D-Ala carboxypeptidase
LTKVGQHARHCLQEDIKKYLEKYLSQEVYSAAGLGVSGGIKEDVGDVFIGVGRAGEQDDEEVNETTIFDLASLTKPLVTLPSILHLLDMGKISWNEPLDSLLERSLDDRFGRVDLYSLLCHCSGFAAHRNYWKKLISMEGKSKKEWLLNKILQEKSEYKKGSSHLYSDVGYILLGYVVEIKSGLALDVYWEKNIAEPAGVEKNLFFNPQKKQRQGGGMVSTGSCSWSKEPLTGLVHDDNCRALGGVAGHAGLFGSLQGVLKLCEEYLHLYHHRKSRLPFSSETFTQAAARVGESDWSCGFSMVSPFGSSSGRYFSPKSIGHLGYTGVSFWIDVDKEVAVSLLTNRVRQGQSMEGIRKVRPVLHDAVMRCLRGKKNPPAEPGEK